MLDLDRTGVVTTYSYPEPYRASSDAVSINICTFFLAYSHLFIFSQFSGEPMGIMQTKLGIIYFLRDHTYKLSEKMSPDMKFDPKAVLLAADGEIYLDVTRD